MGERLLISVQLVAGRNNLTSERLASGWAEEQLERKWLAQFPGLCRGIFFALDSLNVFP